MTPDVEGPDAFAVSLDFFFFSLFFFSVLDPSVDKVVFFLPIVTWLSPATAGAGMGVFFLSDEGSSFSPSAVATFLLPFSFASPV